tara:strand:- start:1466 stop:1675 length:210 start_codon:yes stop_codon:yes gene_type:complete
MTATDVQKAAIQDINLEFVDNNVCAKFETMETQFWMQLLQDVDEKGFCWTKFDVELKFKATKIQAALGI